MAIFGQKSKFFFSIDSTPYWLVPPKIWIFSLKNCWLCKVYRNKPEKQTAPLGGNYKFLTNNSSYLLYFWMNFNETFSK